MDCSDKRDLSTYKIHLWEVYNTLDGENGDKTCSITTKKGSVCAKKSSLKFIKQIEPVNEEEIMSEKEIEVFTCKTHFPKDIKIVPKINNYKRKLIKNYLLQDIARIIIKKVDEIYKDNTDLFQQLNVILIELQPKINPSMKTISHLIYGKLIDFQINEMIKEKCIIKFISANTKLRAYTGPQVTCKLKTKYAQRKWLSVHYTGWFLDNKFSEEQRDIWKESFTNCKKKDDKGDVFLYCINSIHGIPKKQYCNFKKKNTRIK
jgi:hypothetical protein